MLTGLIQLASGSYAANFNTVSPVLVDYVNEICGSKPDSTISSLPLMENGLWIVVATLALYLYFVKIAGPKIMANRKPFDLKPILLTHNILLSLFNCYFFIFALRNTNYGADFWKCSPLSVGLRENAKYKLWVIWFYIMSKFVDLLDTVFFVLRKKFDHVSSLHVIHHTIVPINFWLAFKYGPSVNMVFLPCINSFVHTLMYAYYALAALGPQVRPYLWWKKYLTSIQIGQFVLVATNFAYVATRKDCNVPKVFFIIGLPQVILIMAMFVSFFVKTYSRKDHGEASKNGIVKTDQSKVIVSTNCDEHSKRE